MSNAYGEWLRAQREDANLTQQELADMAVVSRSHIAHIETGRRMPCKDDAKRLDRALNTRNVLSSFLPDEDATVADYFEPARKLEQQAATIREFAYSYVPGILQTKRYAEAVLGAGFPPRSAEECARLVSTRLERAKILDDPATPVVWALIDEAVLSRPIGSPEVMAEQIMHIVQLAERKRVRTHVLPFDLGVHPLLQGMLTLMSFDDQPPAAYSEGAFMGKVHDSPTLVVRLQGAYDLALGEALPMKQSLALMRTIAKEHGQHEPALDS
ncbi:Scr1 family TA system antitoxin-like transcriptional regulator [Streptomyces mirabilis]|uniref:helix-turn-helix domain-containing protein n=1 Tax=Streptomyces mirabilis TaxID=68239 RepID=UPI00368911AB